MATSSGESDDAVSEHSIQANGTNDMICARCFRHGEENGATAICKDCKYYLCSQCVEDHRKDENYRKHKIAFFYCQTNLQVNKLVRANSFCLDCGHYLCQKCKLDHKGFREYRHHTFIGGKGDIDTFFQHDFNAGRNLLSRNSRKTTSSQFRVPSRATRGKSPYLSGVNLPPIEPKKRTVTVDEPEFRRSRTLIHSTTGKMTKNEDPTKKSKQKSSQPKKVHYEEDIPPAKQAELVGEYDLKGQGDKQKCNIIASVFLGNDKLIVADQGNKNIKLYDNNFTYKSSMEIATFPVALCQSKRSSAEFFASSGNKLHLMGTTPRDSLTLIHTTEVNVPKIEGLAPWESGVAVIFKALRSRVDKKGHLEVHLVTFDGDIRFEITISSQFVVKMVTPIWYITTNNDGTELLLADTNLNRIISIDIENWHVVYVLRGKTKGGAPRSLAMDPDGNLLVSWYGEVHKISQSGRDLGVPVTEIDKQSVIAYNQKTKNLVVHSWAKSQTDKFRVYYVE